MRHVASLRCDQTRRHDFLKQRNERSSPEITQHKFVPSARWLYFIKESQSAMSGETFSSRITDTKPKTAVVEGLSR